MRGLSSILSLFRNKFNKINNTGARMLDSFNQLPFKLITNCIFVVKTQDFTIVLVTLKRTSLRSVTKSVCSVTILKFLH